VTSEIKNDAARISVYTDFFNRRIRIDDYSGNVSDVLALIDKSVPDWTEKLIVKARENDQLFFEGSGFATEAFIKGYFSGADMYFLTRYFSHERKINLMNAEEDIIIENILKENKPAYETDVDLVSLATREDAEELANLYATVFKVYPTPLGDPVFLRKTMEEGTLYVVIRQNNIIMSAASAEINRLYSNAELTDCATLPPSQGKGYMKKLIVKLEKILEGERINCLYTIARAESYSMNKVFWQLNYEYGGRMTNNCFIYAGLEDMNVWYKLTNS